MQIIIVFKGCGKPTKTAQEQQDECTFKNDNDEKVREKGSPEWNKAHPHGEFKGSAKHHPNSQDGIGKPPRDGQAALDDSFLVKDSTQRIAIQDGKVIVLKYEVDGVYHGYIHEDLKTLTQKAKNALVENGHMKNATSKKLIEK